MLPGGLLAQTVSSLLTLPRRALVIGNSAYADAPLKNPVNDARAIGDVLKSTGFAPSVLLNAGREQMLNAIREYTESLAKSKSVGLFYFAGHGVQLAWRNYLLPVDNVIRSQEEVPKLAVDVNALMEGILKASNPANIVILDACRDNPFGRDFRVEQKGLSQLDAPYSTLLAYATSPGNVASDGEGENGLYTENLLRELKVPEARIEDVFKRVRLAVRRRSNGRQIPWESTSLEEDFYFVPPKELKKLAEAEKEKHYREQLVLWEKAQAEERDRRAALERMQRELEELKRKEAQARDAATEAARRASEEALQREVAKAASAPLPAEEYLKRFPSGYFSELAELELDRTLEKSGEQRILEASSKGNPYTKGSARADTGYKIGDRYGVRISDLYTKIVSQELDLVVTAINDSEVIFNDGLLITDLMGNVTKHPDGRRVHGAQAVPREFKVGRKWTTRFKVFLPNGNSNENEMDIKIVGKERITVPAGTFDCFRMEGYGGAIGLPLRLRVFAWAAPEVCRRPVAIEYFRQIGPARVIGSDRWELTSFKQS